VAERMRSSDQNNYVPPPDYLDEDEDLIKPKKLVNPVKASRSHQELHRELLSRGTSVETKPELQRVLESRKRDQLIRQRKQEEEARKKISPLEAELLKRHTKLNMSATRQQHTSNTPTTCQQHSSNMHTTHQQLTINTPTTHRKHTSSMPATCQLHANNTPTT
uniref:Actin-associated protein FAM107A n=1 Tax=Nothobranchius furzeri TaxID=105023 RepID=A0A8C6NPN9_NOTFU